MKSVSGSSVIASKAFKSCDSLRFDRGGLFDLPVEMMLLTSDLRVFLIVM